MEDSSPTLSLSDRFSRAAQWTSQRCGRAYTFVAAIIIIAAWAVSGPAFNYSDTWQLIINTGTTIITFLMVFLIQNTQNRDTTAILRGCCRRAIPYPHDAQRERLKEAQRQVTEAHSSRPKRSFVC